MFNSEQEIQLAPYIRKLLSMHLGTSSKSGEITIHKDREEKLLAAVMALGTMSSRAKSSESTEGKVKVPENFELIYLLASEIAKRNPEKAQLLATASLAVLRAINAISEKFKIDIWDKETLRTDVQSIMHLLDDSLEGKGSICDFRNSQEITSMIQQIVPLFPPRLQNLINEYVLSTIALVQDQVLDTGIHPYPHSLKGHLSRDTMPETMASAFESDPFVSAHEIWEISPIELNKMLEQRKAYFIDQKGWLPHPDSKVRAQIIEMLGTDVPDDTFIDSDANDFTQSMHFSVGAEADPSSEKTRARVIRTQPIKRLDTFAYTNGSLEKHIVDVLRSIPLSPYDSHGGTYIDLDVRAIEDPVISDLVSKFKTQPDYNPELLSAAEQAARLIHNEYYAGSPNPVIQQFTEILRAGRALKVIERLTPGKNLVEQTLLMCEMAAESFTSDETIWIMQCDRVYTRVLKSLFGEEAFVQLSETCQIKRDTRDKDENGYMPDKCITMLLDIRAARSYLIKNNPDLASYVLWRTAQVANTSPDLENYSNPVAVVSTPTYTVPVEM
jgi:hypothetical protein